jgi:hypothetical protein
MNFRSLFSAVVVAAGCLSIVVVAGGRANAAPRFGDRVLRGVGPLGASSFSNPIVPGPKIVRPNTPSCSVTLLANQQFANFNPVTGPYAAPVGCPGPWAKVVLDWNVSVAGVQFDRLGALWLGENEIFHFTTSEPPGPQISWHVEKDVTEYSSLLASAQNFTVSLDNVVNGTYTGIYTVGATLTFYEPGKGFPATAQPDAVVAIANVGSSRPWFTLNTPVDQAAATVTLPKNIESAKLEVYASGHGCDEFWYANESTAYANSIGSPCGGTAFRELDVAVDGQLAAIIFPYPYLYTGAIDPNLWLPITGHDTLDIPPYRVDLTPFAGVLTDGQPHTIAVSVYNNSSYWVVDADLLLNVDHNASATSGRLVSLRSGPSPIERYDESHLTSAGGKSQYYARHFLSARGYVDTSHGRVMTAVDESWAFADHQHFTVASPGYFFVTSTEQGTTTETVSGRGLTSKTTRVDSYPLDVRLPLKGALVITQGFYESANTTKNNASSFSYAQEAIDGKQAGSVARTTDHFVLQNSGGYCYDHALSAVNGVLKSNKPNCPKR